MVEFGRGRSKLPQSGSVFRYAAIGALDVIASEIGRAPIPAERGGLGGHRAGALFCEVAAYSIDADKACRRRRAGDGL
jgi:hypothetical protein